MARPRSSLGISLKKQEAANARNLARYAKRLESAGKTKPPDPATRIAALEAEVARLKQDADRWRALLGSARLRPLGWAGFDADSPGHAEGYRHFGMEFWTQHDANSTNARSIQLLTDYADAILALAAQEDGDAS